MNVNTSEETVIKTRRIGWKECAADREQKRREKKRAYQQRNTLRLNCEP
jgi:hypothetical protein